MHGEQGIFLACQAAQVLHNTGVPEREQGSRPPPLPLRPPERPLRSALRFGELFSLFEALPSPAAPSFAAAASPLLFAAFFTSLFVFFSLSCTQQEGVVSIPNLPSSRP